MTLLWLPWSHRFYLAPPTSCPRLSYIRILDSLEILKMAREMSFEILQAMQK